MATSSTLRGGSDQSLTQLTASSGEQHLHGKTSPATSAALTLLLRHLCPRGSPRPLAAARSARQWPDLDRSRQWPAHKICSRTLALYCTSNIAEGEKAGRSPQESKAGFCSRHSVQRRPRRQRLVSYVGCRRRRRRSLRPWHAPAWPGVPAGAGSAVSQHALDRAGVVVLREQHDSRRFIELALVPAFVKPATVIAEGLGVISRDPASPRRTVF